MHSTCLACMKLWVRSPLPHMLTCTKTSWKNSGLAWIMVNAIRSLDWRGVDEDTRINEPVDMGRNSLKEIKARSWESVRSQFKLDLRQCALYVIFFFFWILIFPSALIALFSKLPAECEISCQTQDVPNCIHFFPFTPPELSNLPTLGQF